MKPFALRFAVLIGSLAAAPCLAQSPGVVELGREAAGARPVSLDRLFLYHPGDDPAWADPAYPDEGWEQVNSNLHYDQLPRSGWSGTGWFRIHLHVHPDLQHVPLGFQIWQIGATDVYVNGRPVYSYAQENGTGEETRVHLSEPIHLAADTHYVIAIRHVNPATARLQEAGYRSGVSVSAGSLQGLFKLRLDKTRRSASFEKFFLGGLLVLLLLHLLLYAFNPRARENLYYAVFTAAVAVVTYNVFDMSPVLMTGELVGALHRWNLSAILAPITGIAFAHVLFSPRMPWHFYTVAAIGVVFAGASLADPVATTRIVNVYCMIGLLEFGRIIAVAVWRRQSGADIIGLGAVVLLAGTIQGLVVRMDLIEASWNVNEMYVAGVGALLFSMSAHLARQVARTNRDLRIQLRQVKELSATVTEQEVQRRLLEAEHVRKSQELEEARALQHAMLPSTLPVLPEYEIAVSMRAANEVGGDYYDFHVGDDGALTVVIGDATGHGARAGAMVTAAKSLFTTLAHEPSLVKLLHRFSNALRMMRLPQIYMALALLRVKDGRAVFASAGMPPLLIHRAATGEVEEIVLKGMPLGGPLRFPYSECEIEVGPGDTLLLMSDGLPELFNTRGHMLGYDGASLLFGQAVTQSPEALIRYLEQAADEWALERGQADDMTFVVIRQKAERPEPAVQTDPGRLVPA